jgi:hypothetical protein
MLNLLATRKVYISRILIRCKNESIEARTIVTVILYIEIFIKFGHAMVEILPGSSGRDQQKRPWPAHVVLGHICFAGLNFSLHHIKCLDIYIEH